MKNLSEEGQINICLKFLRPVVEKIDHWVFWFFLFAHLEFSLLYSGNTVKVWRTLTQLAATMCGEIVNEDTQ